MLLRQEQSPKRLLQRQEVQESEEERAFPGLLVDWMQKSFARALLSKGAMQKLPFGTSYFWQRQSGTFFRELETHKKMCQFFNHGVSFLNWLCFVKLFHFRVGTKGSRLYIPDVQRIQRFHSTQCNIGLTIFKCIGANINKSRI
jgi:hypothetical protein